MTALRPLPFPDLVRRMRSEVRTTQAIFDLPIRKWFIPNGELDFSAVHFGRKAATPVGPAAGPHTQLAQNIVLAWLAGSRIIELKTVQVNDRLSIPRPCIHVPNIGYNVEWSQELRVEQSIQEYAKAVYLIEILKHTRGFGVFPSAVGFETIYDISVGYDLDGIRSPKVTGFLDALQHPDPVFDALRVELTDDVADYRDLALPATISDCVTLSTFHGCPADQIGTIGRYLLEHRGLHTIIKLNPTLLGFDRVSELLHDRLGYTHLRLERAAFDADLQYDDGLAMLRGLRDIAEQHGSTIGAQFTNTLVVANDREAFPSQPDPYMYVSGPPLHVLSMTLMQRFREDVGFEMPVSFSAGIDARNFATAVSCGMVPVTTCTDLLRQGGYGRLPPYLRALGAEMKRAGVSSREAFVLAARGNGAAAAEQALAALGAGDLWREQGMRFVVGARETPDEFPRQLRAAAAARGLDEDALVLLATRIAGRLNGREIVPRLPETPRYHASANRKTPRRIESVLALYDCINCDLCITACPNDAIFAYHADPVRVDTIRYDAGNGGGLRPRAGEGFQVAESHQLAVMEGACNECSNCEVYCPEHGAPFQVKERLFLTPDDLDAHPALDGFSREGTRLHCRIRGRRLILELGQGKGIGMVTGDGLRLAVAWTHLEVTGGALEDHAAPFDTADLWRMKVVWDRIFAGATPNPVNPHPATGS